MTNKNIVNIHGNDYITVAGRVQLAHEAGDTLSITSELLPVSGQVVVKATVVTKKGTFTGISAANPSKLIEKQSPYEVAETSAVGRALGFAGYGAVQGIATADEMIKSDFTNKDAVKAGGLSTTCSECGADNIPQKVVDYSNEKWGKTVCYKCQTLKGLAVKL